MWETEKTQWLDIVVQEHLLAQKTTMVEVMNSYASYIKINAVLECLIC